MSRKRQLIIALWCILWLLVKPARTLEEEVNKEEDENEDQEDDDYYTYDDEDDEEEEEEGGKEGSQIDDPNEMIGMEEDSIEMRGMRRRLIGTIPRGIFGPCEKVRSTFDLVEAAGGYVLFFDPNGDPYSCFLLAVCPKACEELDVDNECKYSESEIARFGKPIKFHSLCLWTDNRQWFWIYDRGTKINQMQLYNVFDWGSEQKIHHYHRWNDGGLPPKPSLVEAYVGPGYVWVWIQHPQYDKMRDRLVLGYRVSLMDLEVGPMWDVITFVESVTYRCEFPDLRPIHPCIRWRYCRCICVLISEPVLWTNNASRITESSNKFVKVESYHAQLPMEKRWYSMPYIIPLYFPGGIGSPASPKGPMFGYGNTTVASSRVFVRPYLDYLWIMLLALALLLLVAGLPLVYYMAWRAGHREAETIWRDWAESPGNVGVGLGADAIAWEGKPPWKYRAA